MLKSGRSWKGFDLEVQDVEQELEMISCDNPTTFTSPTLSYISSSNSNMSTVFLQVINLNNSNSP